MSKKPSIQAVKAYSSVSEAGKKENALNEDATLVVSKRQLFGIADGFGGMGIGDEAAEKCLKYVEEFVENGLGDSEVTLPFIYRSYYTSSANLIFNAFLYANKLTHDENKIRHINARGAASVLFAFFEGKNMTIANVGSCTALLVRSGHLEEIIKPRSYNALRKEHWNPHWAFPLMAMGLTQDIEPEITELRVETGDVIILATDGVYPFVPAADFARFSDLAKQPGLDEVILKENQRLIHEMGELGVIDDKSIITMVCA